MFGMIEDGGYVIFMSRLCSVTSNILVDNAWISSHSSAIKFGSSTQGSMNDILIKNVSIYNITYKDINIESRFWDQDVDSWWVCCVYLSHTTLHHYC